MAIHDEVSPLTAVLLHRPGRELRRLTPRNNDALLFDAIPWVDRAQDEHDAFADLLRSRGVEVLLLADLLAETLARPEARERAIGHVVDDLRLGVALQADLGRWLAELAPETLGEVLRAGLRNDEYAGPRTLVTSMLAPEDFVIDPLPNLLFTRDSSVWIGERPAITSLTMPARRRETQLTELIYDHHPRFTDVEAMHGWHREYLEGGDVLALAPGVLAVGVGERTTPAGVERLARALFADATARAVVAVPIDQHRATMHLDTICTMVDVDAVVMYPNVAHRLAGRVITPGDGDPSDPTTPLTIGDSIPFLDAAATAMGLERLRVIDTGLDPVTAEREQWDDGNNTLALAPRVAVAYERNLATNRSLEAAGIEVLTIAGSELGSGRGGPRCMSCPVSREVPR